MWGRMGHSDTSREWRWRSVRNSKGLSYLFKGNYGLSVRISETFEWCGQLNQFWTIVKYFFASKRFLYSSVHLKSTVWLWAGLGHNETGQTEKKRSHNNNDYVWRSWHKLDRFGQLRFFNSKANAYTMFIYQQVFYALYVYIAHR